MKRIIALVVVIFTSACSYEPLAIVSELTDASTITETDDYYRFDASKPKQSCFILYQGAMVKPLSYAPYLQQLAENGFTSYVIKSPFDMAIIDSDGADDVKADEVAKNVCKRYVVAGHSLGGVVAADYVLDKPDHALLFLAAYPQESTSLINHKAAVVSIAATEDGLSTPEKVLARNYLLPAHTKYVAIDGGNHAQFGWYGEQKDDGVATISRDAQQDIVLRETLALLNQAD